jgi:hypothetical protein
VNESVASARRTWNGRRPCHREKSRGGVLDHLVLRWRLWHTGAMASTPQQPPRLIPTGNCWCGCGKDTAIGSFFSQGHDKVAEAALIALEYHGQVAQLLHAHGYGPGRPVVREATDQGVWRSCPYCWYGGARTSVRSHLQKQHPVAGLTAKEVQAELVALAREGKHGMADTREIQLLARA